MQRLTIEVDCDAGAIWDELHGSDLEISLKKWREKRTKDENAYFHVLVNLIARKLKNSDDSIKKMLVTTYGAVATDKAGDAISIILPDDVDPAKFYDYTKLVRTGNNGKPINQYILYKRTSELDTAEMAALIDGTIQEAQALGIDTDTPFERSRKKSIMEDFRK